MKPMTMRERMLAVIEGRPIDRVPFVQYDHNAGPNDEIWAQVGRENLGLLRPVSTYRFESPNCHFTSETFTFNGARGMRNTLHTPEGDLFEERLIEPTYNSSATHKHYVSDPADYRAFMAYLRDITVHTDLASFKSAVSTLGEDGLPHTWVARSPWQQLWVQWVNIQDLSLHMIQCPEIMEEVFELLGRQLRQIFQTVLDIAREAPLPYAAFPDNITAPMIGERYFRQYCLPYYDELAGLLEERKIPVMVHMDGDLKPLWGAIGESKVSGLDSFSPPPDNDTSPAEAAAMWPEMRLLVNFPSSVHLSAPDVIRQRAAEILEEAGHTGHLWIQVSENVPPGVWRKSFPEIIAAIDAFGRP